MNELLKIQTSGIDHIHLNVNELSQAIDFFTGLFQGEHNISLYIDEIDGLNSMNSLPVDVIAPASDHGFFPGGGLRASPPNFQYTAGRPMNKRCIWQYHPEGVLGTRQLWLPSHAVDMSPAVYK